MRKPRKPIKIHVKKDWQEKPYMPLGKNCGLCGRECIPTNGLCNMCVVEYNNKIEEQINNNYKMEKLESEHKKINLMLRYIKVRDNKYNALVEFGLKLCNELKILETKNDELNNYFMKINSIVARYS